MHMHRNITKYTKLHVWYDMDLFSKIQSIIENNQLQHAPKQMYIHTCNVIGLVKCSEDCHIVILYCFFTRILLGIGKHLWTGYAFCVDPQGVSWWFRHDANRCTSLAASGLQSLSHKLIIIRQHCIDFQPLLVTHKDSSTQLLSVNAWLMYIAANDIAWISTKIA